jgi:Lar family restriction alleviation protein
MTKHFCEWASEEYTKIQDYVIKHKLYKDNPDEMSHADIIIAEHKRLILQCKQAEKDIKIKNCPFCGGIAALMYSAHLPCYFMACSGCGAKIEANTKIECYENWNKRIKDKGD